MTTAQRASSSTLHVVLVTAAAVLGVVGYFTGSAPLMVIGFVGGVISLAVRIAAADRAAIDRQRGL